MKFQIHTLGCKVNHAESSGLASELTARGMTEAASAEEADVLLVNSCAVTAESSASQSVHTWSFSFGMPAYFRRSAMSQASMSNIVVYT